MEIFQRAIDLPDEWDQLCDDNYALKKGFLQIMEEVNPCSQRYYLFRDSQGKIDTILMTFEQKKFNLFMFTPIDFYFKVTVVSVPFSVARPGMVPGKETLAEVQELLKSIKGYKLFLNMPESLFSSDFVKGVICPRILMNVRWSSFEEYLRSLRSNYRYRYHKAIKKGAGLKYYQLEDNLLFDHRLYNLYEQVYNHSDTQVEKLSLEYFQKIPAKIFVFENDNEPLGFIQLIENHKELVFAFVGFSYEHNAEYDVYMNLLLKIVQYGIEKEFTVIDFGQTAEDAKLKLGCKYRPLYTLIHHSNKFMHWITQTIIKLIEYKPPKEKFHVFKDEQ